MRSIQALQASCFALAIAIGASIPANAASTKIKKAQEILVQLGYNPGEPDGAWGGKSREALNAFQEAQGFDTTRNLTKGASLALELVSKGAKKTPLPVADRVGNTLVLDVGARIYYSPEGKKSVRLPNGKILSAKWRKKEDGTYCEYVFTTKKEDCVGAFEAGFVIYFHDNNWIYFEKNGKKKYGISMVKGEHLKP
jgi:peptidoglycan hydrolase-like protein with peptidoglycan-binding domain